MARYSRLSKHQVKETRKQTILYIALSITFLFVMFKWGLPALISLATSGGSKKVTTQSKTSDIPVQPPVLTTLPEATPSASIKVEGAALAKEKVRLYVNDNQVDEQQADDNGNFSFKNVALKSGDNKIGVQAIDDSGKESQITESTVVMDNKKPSITVSDPKDDASFFGPDQQRIEIKGKVDEKADVTINGNFVSSDDNGNFDYKTKLITGENDFTIDATDAAGNTGEKTIKVSFSL